MGRTISRKEKGMFTTKGTKITKRKYMLSFVAFVRFVV